MVLTLSPYPHSKSIGHEGERHWGEGHYGERHEGEGLRSENLPEGGN